MVTYPEPKFYNADGSLTGYALACGYIQDRNGWQLFKDGCYHVRRTSEEWATFGSLVEARRALKALTRDNLPAFICPKCQLVKPYGDGSGDCRVCVLCCTCPDNAHQTRNYCHPY